VAYERDGELITRFGQVFNIALKPDLPLNAVDGFVRALVRDELRSLLDETD
jgi:hypothetical protein